MRDVGRACSDEQFELKHNHKDHEEASPQEELEQDSQAGDEVSKPNETKPNYTVTSGPVPAILSREGRAFLFFEVIR